jgi:uncharacterized protein
MFRLFLLIAAIVVLVLLVKRILAASKDNRDSSPRIKQGEDMVRCAHCGLHVPANEAIRSGDRAYCSEEHRRLDQPRD